MIVWIETIKTYDSKESTFDVIILFNLYISLLDIPFQFVIVLHYKMIEITVKCNKNLICLTQVDNNMGYMGRRPVTEL